MKKICQHFTKSVKKKRSRGSGSSSPEEPSSNCTKKVQTEKSNIKMSHITLEQCALLLDQKLDEKLAPLATKKEIEDLKDQISGLQSEIVRLKKQNDILKGTVETLQDREKNMIKTIDRLEQNSRKYKLVFRGVSQQSNVSITEEVKKICKENLKIEKDISVKGAFKISNGNKKNMNVLTEFAHHEDVRLILRNAKLLKNSGIIVHQDQQPIFRKKCVLIRNFTSKLRKINENIKFISRNDKIFVNDNSFTFDEANKLVTLSGDPGLAILNEIVGTNVELMIRNAINETN